MVDVQEPTDLELADRAERAVFELRQRVDRHEPTKATLAATAWLGVTQHALSHAKSVVATITPAPAELPAADEDGFVPTPAPGALAAVTAEVDR